MTNLNTVNLAPLSCRGLGLRLGGNDLLEAVAEAQSDRLLAEIRQLPARDLVMVDTAARRRKAGVEGAVNLPQGLPVRLEVAHLGQ